jgi:ferredoxin
VLLNLVLAAAGLIGVALVALWIWGERGRLLLPSTRKLLHGLGRRSLFSRDFLHAYIYARWTNQYIGWAINCHFPTLNPARVDQRWDGVYHGKVLPTALAKKLITVEQDIPRTVLEQVIPYPVAREIVLQGPPEIAVYECACRHARPYPCQPTQVCMIVGQPFVDFILEHHPRSSRRLTQAEALALLQAEHDRGHVHVAYFKDVMLNRFYAICNCCACCCGGIEATVRRGVPMVIASGFVAEVNRALCAGCGVCVEVCPFGAAAVDGQSTIDRERCMGCGVCESQCAQGAITLVRDARKPAPLDVDVLVKRHP